MHVNYESFREKEQLCSKHEMIVIKMKSLKQGKMNLDFFLVDTGQF